MSSSISCCLQNRRIDESATAVRRIDESATAVRRIDESATAVRRIDESATIGTYLGKQYVLDSRLKSDL